MNETSRGTGPGGGASRGGDPPIGGYPPPSSTTPTVSAHSGAGTTGASSTSTTTSSNNTDLNLAMSTDTDLDGLGEGLSLTRLLAGDTSNWDFSDPLGASTTPHSTHSHVSQGSYRPWEADLTSPSSTTTTLASNSSHDTSSTFTTLTSVSSMAPPPNVLAPPSCIPNRLAPQFNPQYHHYIDNRLPSFQSQFQEIPPPYGMAAHGPHPHYPLVPPPVQAREIPNIQQQFLDERHIQSQHQRSAASTYGSHTPHIAQPRPHYASGGPATGSRLAAHITGISPVAVARKTHVAASTASAGHERATPSSDVTHISAVDSHPHLAAQLRKKTARAGSLEGSESDQSSVDTPGQVAAISSTDPTPETLAGLADAFKPPSHHGGIQHPTPSGMVPHDTFQYFTILSILDTFSVMAGDDPDKPTKKKRKRCGECGGCQKKDNCGECAPCRNDKSHQICKLRRCDRLTEKKPRKPNVSQIF